jgi:hypothetical protein
MLSTCDRLMVPPPGTLRSPEGEPSTKAEVVAPAMIVFQSGTVRTSCIDRSMPASAAYSASWPRLKLPAIIVSVEVVSTSATPRAVSRSSDISARTRAIPRSSLIGLGPLAPGFGLLHDGSAEREA